MKNKFHTTTIAKLWPKKFMMVMEWFQDLRKVEWGSKNDCLIKKGLQSTILDLYITTMVYCYVPMTKISRNKKLKMDVVLKSFWVLNLFMISCPYYGF